MNGKGEYLPRVARVAAALAAVQQDPKADTAAIMVVTAELHKAEREATVHIIDLIESVPQDRDNWQLIREALVYARALAKGQEQEL